MVVNRSGKTYLTDELIRRFADPAGPYKFILITKKGFQAVPAGKIIQGEVITDRREIEAPHAH